MFLEQISWKQAEDYFKKRDLAVIPVGSTENHGSQLALGTDFLIPRNLCERMDSRLNCLIAPTIPYGVADQHTHFPGTITIGYDGLYDLVTRIADQLYGHGIRHFVFLNGHGGNTPVLQRVCMELDDKHAVGCVLDWWSLAGELNPAWKGGHGGGEETAAMLAIDPKYVHMDCFLPFEPKKSDRRPNLRRRGQCFLPWDYDSCSPSCKPLLRKRLVRPGFSQGRHKRMGRGDAGRHGGFLR